MNGPGHMLPTVAAAIAAGPKRAAKQAAMSEQWLANIRALYPWPALEASVRRDIERLRAVSASA